MPEQWANSAVNRTANICAVGSLRVARSGGRLPLRWAL